MVSSHRSEQWKGQPTFTQSCQSNYSKRVVDQSNIDKNDLAHVQTCVKSVAVASDVFMNGAVYCGHRGKQKRNYSVHPTLRQGRHVLFLMSPHNTVLSVQQRPSYMGNRRHIYGQLISEPTRSLLALKYEKCSFCFFLLERNYENGENMHGNITEKIFSDVMLE